MPLSFINIVLIFTLGYLLINKQRLLESGKGIIILVVLVNVIAEGVTYYLNGIGFKKGSSWVYNFSLPVEAIAYGVIYGRLFTSDTSRKIISIGLILIIIPIGWHYFNRNSFFKFNIYLYSYICFIILFCSLYFFIRLFLNDYFYVNPLTQFYFWLSMGLLVCYLGGFMLITNAYTLITANKLLYKDLKILNLFLNIFLYLCIIISTECLKRFKTYQIQSL